VTSKARRLSGYLIKFLLWSGACYGLYYLLFPFYQALVLGGAELVMDLTFRDIGLKPIEGGGFLLGDPLSRHVAPIGFNLFLIGLNLIFAPALVLTTLGATASGVLRAFAAVAIMALLHIAQVVSILYFFLTHARNTMIPTDFSPFVMQAAPAIYTFFDKMAEAMFPFTVWLLLCFGTLASWVVKEAPTGSAQDTPQ
jgi:hypothetical protein